MRNNVLKSAALLLAVIMMLGLTACGPEGAGKAKVVMGTNAAFEPFEFLKGTEVVGFDVDIANEIAKDAESTLVIEDMDFEGLISALNSGKIDMIIAGMTATDERRKSVNFSDPYFKTSQVIIVRKDNTEIGGPDDLVGKVVGVQDGTTGDLFVSAFENDEKQGVEKVEGYKSGVEAGIELANGKLDAVVIDEQPAKKIVEANGQLMILDELFTVEEYAIAVRKDDTVLLDKINATLHRIKTDGTYDKIYGKYFDTTEE